MSSGQSRGFPAGRGTPSNTGFPAGRTSPIGRARPGTFKKGGMVKQTGYAKVHKGEDVLTAKQTKKLKAKKKKRPFYGN